MSGYLGQTPGIGQSQYFTFNCTAGQTTFTGTDVYGYTLNYGVGFVDVFLNGRRLTPISDFTAVDGSTITLLAATNASDVLFVTALSAFSLTNWITNAVTYVYVATAGQSSFSGSDINGQTLAYVAGALQVSVNGIVLPPNDYGALNGSTVILGSAVNAGDIVQVFSLRTINPINISSWITNNLTNIADYTYIATQGQTNFGGVAYAGGTLVYKPNCIEVIVNGLVLTPADYVATSGTTVVLNVGCNADDTVVIRVFGNTTVAGVYTQAQSDAKYATGNNTNLVLTSSGGGQSNVYPASSASNTSIVFPARSGNVMLDGPSFSVYSTIAQTIGTTPVKIQFNVEEWDTANCFDSTTNYRFTPNVAGYYQVNMWIRPNNNYAQWTYLYKNGAGYKNIFGSSTSFSLPLSTMVYCNGTTDYLEVYFYSATAINTVPGSTDTWFNGFLARGA